MPWKTSSVMEEKLRFVFEYEQGHRSMTELCQRYEIARETGYVWLRRYRERGLDGLVEHRRGWARAGERWAGGAQSGGMAAWEPDASRDRADGVGTAPGAHAMGSAEVEANPGAG